MRSGNLTSELGLATVLGEPHLTFDDIESRAKLALYVEQRFRIASFAESEVGADIELTLVGAELDGDFILVYQELKSALPWHIAARDDILRDGLPAQANQVNIAFGDGIRTLMFARDDRWRPFESQEPPRQAPGRSG